MGYACGHGFDVVSAPATSNGAYSAGDIVGDLMTFSVSDANNGLVIITGITVAVKSAVTSSLKLVLLNASPSSTTTTDNAAYSLAVADAYKVISVVDFTTSGALLTDHGTPNTYSLQNLNIVCAPDRNTQKIYALLIDGTGWTLTSTQDIQVRLMGLGV